VSKQHFIDFFITDCTSENQWNESPHHKHADFGCTSWFSKKEWLSNFWSILPRSFATGEDIQLSGTCSTKRQVRTLIPRQVKGLSGNIRRGYGFDEYASFKNPAFLEQRDDVSDILSMKNYGSRCCGNRL
jgi:hypothetical protein